jgi:hypothetical protein
MDPTPAPAPYAARARGVRRGNGIVRCDPAARRLVAALSAVAVLASCAHVRPTDPTAAGVNLDDINAKLAGRVVRVRLRDGTELVAHDVRVSADSVFMRPQRLREVDWWLAPAQALPVSEVGTIEVTRRGRGALDGALIGLAAGAAAGATLGALMHEPGDLLISSPKDAAILGGILLGVLGTGLGFLAGASKGSTDVYDLTAVRGATRSATPGE